MRKRGILFVSTLLVLVSVCARGASDGVHSRASWLSGVQAALFSDVERQFKTRYDGAVWAKACREPVYARRLGLDKNELNSFVLDRLRARKDHAKILPLERSMLVNAVVGMTETYLQGGRAFVNPGRQDCALVLKGLRREFPR